MATSAGTTAADVRVEIDTGLDDSKIDDLLGRIEREWQREYDGAHFGGADHITDFEAALTALRIAEGWDRRAEQTATGPVRRTYETREIANLRQRVRQRDPGDEFGHSSRIRRDTGRHIATGDDP